MAKQAWLVISAIPTLILVARGFTITIGEATMDAGLKITDIAAVIVFFLLAFAFVVWLLSIIIANIYNRFTRSKKRLNSTELKSIVDNKIVKQKEGSTTIIAISAIVIVAAFTIWNNWGKPSQRKK
jgi:hypothetical protein